MTANAETHNFVAINPPLRDGQYVFCSAPQHVVKYGSTAVYERDEPMADIAAAPGTFYCKACRDREANG